MSSNNHTIPANLKLALTVKEATEYQRCIIHPVRKILRYVGEKEKKPLQTI